MVNHKRVIMLEFNELCPRLMDQFIGEGRLKNFKRLRDQSECYVTDANESVENLEPWIQWITIHTGLSYEEHGVFNLGDADQLKADNIWDILSQKGFKNWICGSMNARYNAEGFKGALLPDPWSNGIEPTDKQYEPFFKFVCAHVQEHDKKDFSMETKDYLSFLRFLFRHGLTFETFNTIVKQLVREKTHQEHWKRATILDKLQWDVFAHRYRRDKPDFATFFANSTAHFQHKYWRYMEPERFAIKSSEQEQEKYQHAIRFGYESMDALVGKAMALKDPDTALVLCTALSQQPYTKADEMGGKYYYRPHSFDTLLEKLNLAGVERISPVMSEEFHILCRTEEDAIRVDAEIQRYTVNGKPLLVHRREGNDVFSGCAIHEKLPEDATIAYDGKPVQDFYSLFYRPDSLKSGMHHPDGIFWVASPSEAPVKHQEKLPLTEVMPRVLRLFNIQANDLSGAA